MKCECGGTVHIEKGPGDYVASWCDRCTPVVKVRIPLGNPYLDRLAKDGINAHGKKSEKKTVKALGARAHRGSGSGRGSKSDATKGKFRCEMKSTTTQACPIELAWLVKIGQEAVAHGQMPAVVISFVDNQGNLRMANGQWVLVPVSVFKEWCDGRNG